jgi:DNA-binding GntR family transcriptional regulator
MDRESSTSDRLGSQQIAAVLRGEIEDGKYPVGAALPPYRTIKERFGVAMNTTQAAVKLLEQSGHVTIKPSAGVVVADRTSPAPAEQQLAELQQRLREMRDTVRQASDAVAGVEQQLSDLADRIHVGAGQSDT